MGCTAYQKGRNEESSILVINIPYVIIIIAAQVALIIINCQVKMTTYFVQLSNNNGLGQRMYFETCADGLQ